ncbi:hypothetical protein CK203_106336 [Vitis vinifera]|uniref:Reverse transcriptase/retrotransposon-derived protein RNase H-like domain-containing protein n=1 Tax=Vitis vinifera TaxID=29760 RepID=A0A438BNN9_VITVI|nr:hypothetical protein CK203_106336 [Vitis vinifera]
MLIAGKATCIVFSVDDLPLGGSDHTLPLYIFVGCSGHRVPYVLLDNGSALNVCLLAPIVALGFKPSNFESSSQIVRAYDSTRIKVLGTLTLDLQIGLVTFSALFQVLRIPTSFNLLLGWPWIHRAGAISSSLHQKPVLEISHGDDDLFLTCFTFDEIQTVEVEQFCRDHVALLFDEHGSTVVLDMMRSMSFLPGLRLGCRQHGSRDFIAIVDHDTPFGLGFVPMEADYRYMALLHKKRLKARLLHMPFDYLVRPYRMSLEDYFVRAPETQMHLERITSGLSETNEYETSAEIVDMIDGVIPCDEYNDEILMVDMTCPCSWMLTTVPPDDDVFMGATSPVVVESEHVDTPLSFDVLSGFVSRSDDDSKVRVCVDFRDLNKASLKDDFPLQHIDMLIDSTTGHSMLSFMDGFSRKLLGYMVSKRDIKADPNKIRAILDMPASRIERKIRVLVPPTPGRPLLLYLSVSDIALGCMLAQLNDSGKKRAIYYLSKRMLDYEMRYVMIECFCLALTCFDWSTHEMVDEDITVVTSLSGWCMYFDGATNHYGYEIGVLLISPHGDHIPRFVRLTFSDRHPAMNNIVAYEACILGLETTLELKIRQIELLVRRFDDLSYTHLPRAQNQFADALATLASMIDIPIDFVVRLLLIESRSVPVYCCLIDEAKLDDGLPWFIEGSIGAADFRGKLAQTRLDQLSLLNERRLRAANHVRAYQRKMTRAFKKWVKPRPLQRGDMVLKVIRGLIRDPRGKFRPNWSGPYFIMELIPDGAAWLMDLDGNRFLEPTNVDQLKKYYV